MIFIQRIAAWSKQLVVRVYLFSIALIIISALVIVSAGKYFSQKTFRNMPEFILSTVTENWEQPQLMHEKALRLKNLVGDQITLYDAGNNLILTTAQTPAPPLSHDELQRLKREGKIYYPPPKLFLAASVVRDGAFAGYGLLAPGLKFSFQPFFLTIILLCAVIAVFSIIFARSLAVPISRLSSTATAFGKGDFAVRTNIRRNDELGYLAKAFDEMADRVNDLLRSQKELLANVSHELRTPLSRIRVALDIAAESASEFDQKQWSETVHDLEELEQLIADVLMATRLELEPTQHSKAALPLRFEPVDPEPFLRAIADRFCSMHQSHHLNLSVEGPHFAIMADPRLLRRVVENIIDNARKYSSPGSTIAARAHHDTAGLVVEISDHGIGIAEADIENVFKPFFRTDRSRTRSTGGVGLGLTLSQRIIEAHGGSIRIASRLNSGTTVCFSVPYTPQSVNSPSS
ncbi:MAG: HAMP domain-containing sensor histidine kinase [Proteobacteria bacterium]|nr:HAMP domain-containing sensor histidine kinase [Pseudomonadota bacterium]